MSRLQSVLKKVENANSLMEVFRSKDEFTKILTEESDGRQFSEEELTIIVNFNVIGNVKLFNFINE